MSESFNYLQLNACVLALDRNSIDCKADISRLRRLMDVACDSGHITITQWRTLLDRISEVQAGLTEGTAQSWRHPRFTVTAESKKA